MSHPPDYESYGDKPRPPVNFDTPDGSWVGIWGYDWADLIGKYIVRIDHHIAYEVWQPDFRAQTVYSHTFEDGWVHKMFPADREIFFSGVKRRTRVSSSRLVGMLRETLTPETILILPFSTTPLVRSIAGEFKNYRILGICLGDLPLPLLNFWTINKNIFSKINLLYDHYALKNVLPFFNGVSLINHNFLGSFKRLYSGKHWIVPMGIDCDFWCPLPKVHCRAHFNLPKKKMVFFSASRLNTLKQVDKTIEVLIKTADKFDFLYIVAGHGTRDYEDFLRRKAAPLLERDMIRFIGYVSDDDLLQYYNAADVFILTSRSEGSPVGVQKAFACETPVLSTDVGYTAELMQKYNAGSVIPKDKRTEWEKQFQTILEGSIPRPFDRDLAVEYFDWPNIARQFIHIFENL